MSNCQIPLSLYIHIPWCIKKCPYCDFNSHPQRGEIPEKKYIDQLIMDLQSQLPYVQDRPLQSIFIGGGTPSVFSPEAYSILFDKVRREIDIPQDIEITMEANPGTLIPNRFKAYRQTGINRISLGVQSFQNEKLQALGRIHDADHAINAVTEAQNAGFEKINVDLMFGLPNQTQEDALFDLQSAIHLSPTHLSWYQLTLEPNTYFHRFPPTLPTDDERFDIQQAGQELLKNNHFKQYEISAYGKSHQCRHNLNYWLFGDYLGIGAGAHAKLTDLQSKQILRRESVKHPKQYLSATSSSELIAESKIVLTEEKPLEFMMNVLRLNQPIPIHLFEMRTGLSFSTIEKSVQTAIDMNFLTLQNNDIQVTDHGRLFLNELLEVFLRI